MILNCSKSAGIQSKWFLFKATSIWEHSGDSSLSVSVSYCGTQLCMLLMKRGLISMWHAVLLIWGWKSDWTCRHPWWLNSGRETMAICQTAGQSSVCGCYSLDDNTHVACSWRWPDIIMLLPVRDTADVWNDITQMLKISQSLHLVWCCLSRLCVVSLLFHI